MPNTEFAKPSKLILRQARDRFADMLSRPTKEADWQRLFAEHPYILSESLPLALSPWDIVPRGRPGKSEADFVFYPSDRAIPIYGVIELKRPDSKILALPRRNILCLSADGQTALSQAKVYAEQLDRELLYHPSRMLVVGNKLYAFIIMGLSAEIATKVTSSILRQQYAGLLPPNLQLIPYDSLFKMFSERIAPDIYLLSSLAANPPATVRMESGTWVVDYTGQGAPRSVKGEEALSMAGVVLARHPAPYLRLRKPGVCPFCGRLDGARSLAGRKYTSAGELELFFTGSRGGIGYRAMQCIQHREAHSGLFREEYDAVQVQRWFEQLRSGICGRCGHTEVSHSMRGTEEVAWEDRWICSRCGFWDIKHSWGPMSSGA